MTKPINPQHTRTGLSGVAAANRLKSEGYNELPRHGQRGVLRIIYEVLTEPMFALLISGGIIYLLLGDKMEALFLLLFATLSVTISIVQESRSENVLEALRNLASPRALVMRDEKRIHIAGREVVRDDLIIINEGDRVVADAWLIYAHDLLLDESLLTGESVAVHKPNIETDAAMNIPVAAPAPGGDGLAYVFAGTLVMRGTGHAIVHATGIRSEMGKIGHALGTITTEQPKLQQQIKGLVRHFAIIGSLAGGLTVLLYGLLRGSWLEAMLVGISLGMSLLPQEFPLVMAVFMAMGAWRISQVRVLTRRASAIETLGATTVLCTDKTGTLTENRMTVVALISPEARWNEHEDKSLNTQTQAVLEAALLACPREAIDPMDRAIHALVSTKLDTQITGFANHSLIRTYGLRPDLLAVTNVTSGPDQTKAVVYSKGAIEAIAALCQLADDQLLGIRKQVDTLATEGIRVLAVAKTDELTLAKSDELPESARGFSFTYLGLIGFTDPLRENVPAAVAECRSAGIRVVMITGDYPATATAIGQQAGLHNESVLIGDEIDALDDHQLAQQVKTTSIFARIRPNQKLRIVQSLKADGEIVAMTGDGVNDAPAIKAANIGIAMGGRGTDVAREASAIVLLDDDFGSIVKTIRLGRRIYDNLRKAIEYIVAVHIPIAGLALLPLLLGLPMILSPIHIAFLEMVIDPACSIIFEAEKEEDDIMRRPPRAAKSQLLLPKRMIWAVLQGMIVTAILSGIFIYKAHSGMPVGDIRALIFTLLVIMNMSLILVNRSFNASLLQAFLKPNKSLWILLSCVLIMLGLALFWHPAQILFQFGQLHWDELGLCATVGISTLLILELLKAQWFREGDNPAMVKQPSK